MSNDKKTFVTEARRVLEEWGVNHVFAWETNTKAEFRISKQELETLCDRIAYAVLVTCARDAPKEELECSVCGMQYTLIPQSEACPSCDAMPGAS